MRLPLGFRLGDYEVSALLGIGGMGEVYRAHDTKLQRDVALKVLPDAFSQDSERLARFQREAEILASLNHPNIAAIYGLAEENDTRALVLELVEGVTLAERIAQGPLPMREAIDIAGQIAQALEAAHERGVLHRDLKPANIRLRPDGAIKVLDFGLAKWLVADQPTSELSNAPTRAPSVDRPGTILGTMGYMSPEQVRAQPVDRRSDIWAFGCVLFEMLTGRRAFDAGTASDFMVEVLRGDPDWAALPGDTPPPIRRLLHRCLAKERKERLSQMEVVRWELLDAFAVAAVEGHGTRASWFPRTVVTLAMLAIACGIGAFLVIVSNDGAAPQLVTHSTISVSETIYISSATVDLAITRDGRRIVYAGGTSDLHVRSLDQLEPQLLYRTGAVPLHPFVSPDGQWVGYFDTGRAGLFKVSIRGGSATMLCEYQGLPRGASWGPNGIVFATDTPGGGLFQVSEDGGTPERLTTAPPGFFHWWPEVLPSGNGVLFTLVPSVTTEKPMIAAFSLETRAQKTLLPGSSPRFAPPRHLLFGAGSSVLSVQFDPDRLAMISEPVVVVDSVVVKNLGAADFAVSNDGTIAYIPDTASDSILKAMMWVDRTGREESLTERRPFFQLALSADGSRAAALVLEPLNHDIWEYDLDVRPSRSTRLTFDPASDISPLWTLDGRRIVFASTRDGGHYNLFWRASDGTGDDERLTTSPNTQNPVSWSNDGKTLLFWELSPGAGYDLYQMSVEGDRTPRVLLATPFNESQAAISPDGRWLAYQSDESGVVEVYVRPFPDLQSGRWQVSVEGGAEPVWRGDGREIFYRINQSIKAVKIETTPVFEASRPEVVLQGAFFFGGPGRKYGTSPDGKRFLVMKEAGTPPNQINIVQNWFEGTRVALPIE